MLHIVLLEPEIPPNTGNIVRTCAALGANLHLVEPLGFSIDEASIRRAGLDYWDQAKIQTYPNLDQFFATAGCRETIWLASTKAPRAYHEVHFPAPCWIMLGCETKGLPESLLYEHASRVIRLPMRPGIRSLNLANTAAVLAFEVMRQWNWPGLEGRGKMGGEDFTWQKTALA
jgi:tRNA (cytidine/uridine-2'-O-)-methyltransferase